MLYSSTKTLIKYSAFFVIGAAGGGLLSITLYWLPYQIIFIIALIFSLAKSLCKYHIYIENDVVRAIFNYPRNNDVLILSVFLKSFLNGDLINFIQYITEHLAGLIIRAYTGQIICYI